jgi:GNAT superfamily N-acetyltransferase
MAPADPPVVVRRATRAEAARLAEFAARTFVDTFGSQNDPDHLASHVARHYHTDVQAAELANPHWVTLVIDGDDGYVGYAQLRTGDAPECAGSDAPVELVRFYVDRPWHGRGVARPFMDAVYRTAADMGGHTIWLGVWERNPRAIAFYEKIGYRTVGTKPYVVGADHQTDFVMMRALPHRAAGD